MKIHNVSISEGCIACAACAEICPEVFSLEPECHVLQGADLEFFHDWIEQSQEICPVDVIVVS